MYIKTIVRRNGFVPCGNANGKGLLVPISRPAQFKRVFALAASFGGINVAKNTGVYPQTMVLRTI